MHKYVLKHITEWKDDYLANKELKHLKANALMNLTPY
jgi:hypothetical protein